MSSDQFLVKRGNVIMKKLLVFLMCLTLLVAAAMPAAAMTHHRRYHARHYHTGRTYYTYSEAPHRTFWQKHRDKLTVAGGALGGAMIGGIAGGHKGAGIGALAGAGASALYTYKLRKRHHRH
jgi:outer membrane lipoprotein SlyB